MSAKGLGAFAEEEAGMGCSAWNSPEEILKQLERLVCSPHFRNSKRYPALLRYLVEQSLLGRSDFLKERTLGVEVFGRPADYDTNADPVVRITAGEVRKRIAQYYQSPDHEHELRLELPLGSYAPHFLPPHGAQPSPHAMLEPFSTSATSAVALQPVQSGIIDAQGPLLAASPSARETTESAEPARAVIATVLPLGKTAHLRSKRVQAILALCILAVVASCAAIELNSRRQDAGLTFFWGPMLHSREPAMIVLGVHSFDTHGNDLSPISFAQLPQVEQTALSSMIRSNMVPVSDVVSYSKIVSLLARQALPFHTQSAAETTIEEFRGGPLILIGGFDNMWTMRLTSSLRFHFVADSASLHEIQDSEHPELRWQFDNAQSALSNSRDYAIVAQFFDPQIEQHAMVVAGIGKSGTEAAAEFLTDKQALRTWVEATPADHHDNVEIVLATDIIEGKHGPPHVIASYRW